MIDGLSESAEEAIRSIAKAELHVHLEGSLAPDVTLSLARKHRVDIGAQTVEGVRDLYRFTDFAHFLRLYGELTFLLATPSDFTDAVRSYAKELSRQGGIYAELTLTLGTHVHFKQMDPEAIMRAAWKGAKQAFDEFGVTIRFLLDHVRSFPMERCLETVKWCDEFRQFGVVGLGLAGPEKGWPSSTYKEALNLAEQLEVPFVPHAGEETDSGDIWDALEFSPKRIGHGLSSSDDERLLEELRRASIMVEVCPTSNVVLNHVENFGTHPARRLFDAGVPISLNSDDPPMFGTSLLREYALAYTDLGFSLDDLRAVARMSLEHALVDGRTKEELLAAAEQA